MLFSTSLDPAVFGEEVGDALAMRLVQVARVASLGRNALFS